MLDDHELVRDVHQDPELLHLDWPGPPLWLQDLDGLRLVLHVLVDDLLGGFRHLDGPVNELAQGHLHVLRCRALVRHWWEVPEAGGREA
eukprot:3490337-Alexandrium_andersonii.AAC.1